MLEYGNTRNAWWESFQDVKPVVSSGNLSYAPIDYSMGNTTTAACTPINIAEKVTQIPQAWDGLILQSRPRPEYPLITGMSIYSPIGDGITLTADDTSKPSVDGDPSSPRQLFMLAYNQVRPECCPSEYSTSAGCVCLTQKQRAMLTSGH
jgi:xanthine dehydrogenase molybdopterin-binding subunit B